MARDSSATTSVNGRARPAATAGPAGPAAFASPPHQTAIFTRGSRGKLSHSSEFIACIRRRRAMARQEHAPTLPPTCPLRCRSLLAGDSSATPPPLPQPVILTKGNRGQQSHHSAFIACKHALTPNRYCLLRCRSIHRSYLDHLPFLPLASLGQS